MVVGGGQWWAMVVCGASGRIEARGGAERSEADGAHGARLR